ncbi:MAG: glycoside hydrolase family 36 protein [Terrimicrobiaceae bacterium]
MGNKEEKEFPSLHCCKYLVIDAGWYADTKGNWNNLHGDWAPSNALFPEGLAVTAQRIRERGLIPGIWFEFENCQPKARAFADQSHFLKRDGHVIHTNDRSFWDFRDPWVVDYLSNKVIALLKRCNFGYLKVDYNETIGIGCDGAESLGEGLRQHLEGVQAFWKTIRREMPDLVIENCASGGTRLEPSMMALAAMGSSTDAHETLESPVIAANVQRLILPRQSQIWSVVRKKDSRERLVYTLTASFLGRMCLSGDIPELGKAQWELVEKAMALYRKIWPIIKDGRSVRFGPDLQSYRHPEGWQAVVRMGKRGRQALVVVHVFAKPLAKTAQIDLQSATGHKGWKIVESFTANPKPTGVLRLDRFLDIALKPFTASVFLLGRR